MRKRKRIYTHIRNIFKAPRTEVFNMNAKQQLAQFKKRIKLTSKLTEKKKPTNTQSLAKCKKITQFIKTKKSEQTKQIRNSNMTGRHTKQYAYTYIVMD